MKQNIQAYCAFGGLSAFFALEYVGFLATPPFTDAELPLLTALGFNIMGVVCGVLIMQHARNHLHTRQHYWVLPLVVALLTLAGTGLRMGVALGAVPLWTNCAGSFVSGLFFPLLLRWLMNTSTCPGLMLAGALSLSELVHIYALFVPHPIDIGFSMSLSAVYQGAVGLCCGLCLLYGNIKELQDSDASDEDIIIFSEFDISNLLTLGLFFFPLSFLLDLFLYREQLLLVPQMMQLHLFIWASYLLWGIFFDNNNFNKQDILLTITIVVFASVLFVVNTGISVTLFYCFSYAIELTARCCAFIFFTTFIHRPEFTSLYPKIDPSYVYVVQCLVFILICKIFPLLHVNDLLYIAGIGLPLSVLYAGYCVCTRTLRTRKQDLEPVKRGSMLDFAAQYDLSPREIEVLQQIVAGRDTDIICAELHVSKNTVKTHIRQILRKVNSKNRNELLIVFFDFCLKAPEDDSLENSTP